MNYHTVTNLLVNKKNGKERIRIRLRNYFLNWEKYFHLPESLQTSILLFLSAMLFFTNLNGQHPVLMLPAGPSSGVKEIKYSHDGRYIMSVSEDIKIWDVASGKVLRNLNAGSGVLFAIFSSHDTYIISSAYESIEVWDTRTGSRLYSLDNFADMTGIVTSSDEQTFTISMTTGPVHIFDLKTGKSLKIVNTIATRVTYSSVQRNKYIPDTTFSMYQFYNNLSADGRYAVSTSESDTHAHIWDISTGKEVSNFIDNLNYYFTAAFSPDNNYVISCSEMDYGYVWDLVTQKLLYKKRMTNFYPLRYQDASQMADLFSPNNKFISIPVNDSVTEICQLSSGMLLFTINQKNAYLKFSSDSKFIIASSGNGLTNIWEVMSGKLIFGSEEGHTKQVIGVEVSPVSATFATASDDNSIKIWNLNSGRLKETLKGRLVDYKATFSIDNQYIILNSTLGNSAIAEISTGKVMPILNTSQNSYYSKISPSGAYMVTISSQDSASCWDLKSKEIIFSFSLRKNHKVYFSPDERYFLSINPGDSGANLYSVSDKRFIGRITQRKDATTQLEPFFSMNGKFVTLFTPALSATTFALGIWDCSTGKLSYQIKEKKDTQVWEINFSPNERYLAMANSGFVEVWDLENKMLKAICDEKTTSSSSTSGVGFSNDSKLIVAGGRDTAVNIWDISNAQIVAKLKGNSSSVNRVEYSPGGHYIITHSMNGEITVWNALSFSVKYRLTENTSYFISLSFDDKYMVIKSTDNIFHFRDLATGKFLYSSVFLDNGNYLSFDNYSRYDGTEDAFRSIYYACGDEVIELEKLKQLSWEPSLVSKIMGNNKEPITAKPISEINICGFKPSVQGHILVGGNYEFNIVPGHGGIGQTSLYVNNKKIKTLSTSTSKKRSTSYKILVTDKDIEKYLAKGEENSISIKVTTENDQLYSKGTLTLGSDNIDGKSSRSNLYCISVGICKYKLDSLKLHYASQDAADFDRYVCASARNLLNGDGEEHIIDYVLNTDATTTDRWPTKSSIKKVFSDIAGRANPNDILLVFLSGHGVLNNKTFYFLTAEASSFDIRGTEDVIAISAEELGQWMANISAKKQVLILDACNSGQAIEQLARKKDIPSDQQKALDKLREMTGTYLLSAAASGQSAWETSQYNQGLLTYSLLLGMKSGKGLKDNKFLDISNWFQFAAENVTDLAKDVSERQNPQISENGTFQLGIVDPTLSEQISLSFKKPLFKKSSFFNEDLFVDDAEFGEEINKQLKNLTYSGKNSPLSYYPDFKGSDVYSINGRYKISEDNIIIGQIKFLKGLIPVQTIPVNVAKEKLTDFAKTILSEIIKQL